MITEICIAAVILTALTLFAFWTYSGSRKLAGRTHTHKLLLVSMPIVSLVVVILSTISYYYNEPPQTLNDKLAFILKAVYWSIVLEGFVLFALASRFGKRSDRR